MSNSSAAFEVKVHRGTFSFYEDGSCVYSGTTGEEHSRYEWRWNEAYGCFEMRAVYPDNDADGWSIADLTSTRFADAYKQYLGRLVVR